MSLVSLPGLINMIGEISIDPKFGKNLLIKFRGGAVSLYEISKMV